MLSAQLINGLPQEYLHKVVEEVRETAAGTDPVTGKQRVQPRAKTPLFLPGRIIHITWGTIVTKYVYYIPSKRIHIVKGQQ